MYMNEVSIAGRLAADPQFTAGATPERDRIWCWVAIPRNNGNTVDFMACVAWGATARVIRDHYRKGKVLMVQGQLRTHHSSKGEFYAEVAARNVSFGPDAHKTADPVARRIGGGMTQKEAYEHNKKLVNCIVCGKELQMHPSVGVKYCKCIEQLP